MAAGAAAAGVEDPVAAVAAAAAVAGNVAANQPDLRYEASFHRLQLMYPSMQSARKAVLSVMPAVQCSKLKPSELSQPAKGILSGTLRMKTLKQLLTVPVQLWSSETSMRVRGSEESRYITLSLTARVHSGDQLWLQAYLWLLVYLFHGIHPSNRPNTDAWNELVAVIG
jgi:hypothetical protein